MEFQDLKQHLQNKKINNTDATGGDAIVTFGPVSIPRGGLIEDITWLHGLTKADDFDTAIAICWHKVTDKIGRERISQIVHLYRLSQDGKSRPPFLFEKEYQKISGVVSAPTMTLEPTRR